MEFKDIAADWIEKKIFPVVATKYKIKTKYLKNSDFGECVGIDFDSPTRTGYIYLWAAHMLGFGIFDLEKNEMLVEQEFVEFSEFEELENLIFSFIKELS